MFTQRTTVIATLAVLALGLAGCASGDAADPTTPVPTAVETTPVAEPAEPPAETQPAETPEASEPAGEPSEAASPSEPVQGGMPMMAPADGLPGAAACYDESGANRTLEGSSAPEPGAVKAWLCGDAPGGYGSVGPMEPLLTGIDDILADYDALPEPAGEGPQEAAGAYRVVFEYSDGTFAVIEGDAQEEGPVWAGDAEKVGGTQFLNQVRGRWLDQRLAVGGPGEESLIHAMACPAPEHYLVAHPVEEVVTGWFCDAGTAGLAMQPELAQQIAAELRDNSTSAEGDLPASGATISLIVPWGEANLLKKLDDGPGYLWISDQGAMEYAPSTAVEEGIAAALAG